MLSFIRVKIQENIIKNSGLFSTEYYLEKNPDVKEKKVSPIMHYIKFGWKEGRNPSKDFDTKFYLRKNHDVLSQEIKPLVYYVKYEKRKNE